MKNLNSQALIYAHLIEIAARAIRSQSRTDKSTCNLGTNNLLEEHLAARIASSINKKVPTSC